jgi:hypothetical protein
MWVRFVVFFEAYGGWVGFVWSFPGSTLICRRRQALSPISNEKNVSQLLGIALLKWVRLVLFHMRTRRKFAHCGTTGFGFVLSFLWLAKRQFQMGSFGHIWRAKPVGPVSNLCLHIT